MNKIVLLFLVLFLTFCGTWIFKSKTPLNRKLNDAVNLSNWWENDGQIAPLSNEVSEEWYLDPRIPSDYVPVLGQDNLYMQVDENGTIIAYWQCEEDGNKLIWKKVNPDIPDNFEPVEGLEDVYKVTDSNGNVLYYKYIRNPDNSFTFVEVDSKGNIIDEYITACETTAADNNMIPENYMQLNGDIYGVKNKDGVIVDYKEMGKDDNGKITWKQVDPDNVVFLPTSNNGDAWSGITGGKKSGSGNNAGKSNNGNGNNGSGNVNGNGNTDSGNLGNGKTTTSSRNHGVVTNTLPAQGTLPAVTSGNSPNMTLPDSQQNPQLTTAKLPTSPGQSTLPQHTTVSQESPVPGGKDPAVTTAPQTQSPDYTTQTRPPVTEQPANTTTKNIKTHTQKETYQEVTYEGDYKCTYEYSIIKTFDEYGVLLSSETQGPVLINREYVGSSGGNGGANPGLVESSIDNEIMRVTNGLSNSSAGGSVINALNAERSSKGLQTLNNGSDAQKLATLFAADMATYDNTSSSSPTYGTIDQMMSRYNIGNQGYGLNIWRTTSDDAQSIHKRFQSINNCRTARMNENFNQVGVAIYYNNGYYYVAEVLLKQ